MSTTNFNTFIYGKPATKSGKFTGSKKKTKKIKKGE